jgi:hypothetical protein
MGELVFDFIFSPDEPDEKIINSFSDIINEKDLNVDYLKKISRESIGYEFEVGIELLETLISRKIDKIKIRIDLSGKVVNDNTFACYHPGLSNSNNFLNEPSFSVSRSMLRDSLTSYQNNNFSFNNVLTWEHEIIHWLDDSLEKYNVEDFFGSGDYITKRFLYQLFAYRSEGLADLAGTLMGLNGITCMESARKEFSSEIKRVFKVSPSRKLNPEFTLQKLDRKASYDIGPWMIFHVLSCPEYSERFPGIEEVMLKQKDYDNYDQVEIISLLKNALNIDNYTFLKYLTLPGVDGQPFINTDQIRLIRKTMKMIPNGREDIKYYEKKYPEESGSIIKIIEFYNWFGNEQFK